MKSNSNFLIIIYVSKRMKNFKNKKCLITGAASGIGKATALAMGKLGANLFLTDINSDRSHFPLPTYQSLTSFLHTIKLSTTCTENT